MSPTQLTARFATPDEVASWDELVAANPGGGEFLSARAFAETKRTVGWRPRYVVFTADRAVHSVALVLERRTPPLGRLWYLPRGPAALDASSLHAHTVALRELAARERDVFAVTLEPPIQIDPDAEDPAGEQARLAAAAGLRARPAIQGNATTAVVRLDRDDEALLASFDKKCRNMIRRAERDGVIVRRADANPETFAHMHRLMRLVGGGAADLALRPQSYSETLWSGFASAGQGQFTAIDVDGTPAVMGFMIRIGDRAFYKDGGSERDRVTPGMSNLLIWEMMRDARAAGARELDLFGVAPAWATSTAEHPAYGLGLFKLSFARERTTFAGAFDLVVRPARYALWSRFGERIAQRLHRRRYRDLGLY